MSLHLNGVPLSAIPSFSDVIAALQELKQHLHTQYSYVPEVTVYFPRPVESLWASQAEVGNRPPDGDLHGRRLRDALDLGLLNGRACRGALWIGLNAEAFDIGIALFTWTCPAGLPRQRWVEFLGPTL